jgi:restriction endonuclease
MENNKIKKEIIKKDDRSIRNPDIVKTTIKPSDKEIEELKTLWEKFHKELLDKTDKKSEK